MTVNLKRIISVAEESGLFRLISPSFIGLLLESLDETKQGHLKTYENNRMKPLNEMNIHTLNIYERISFEVLFSRLYTEFDGALDPEAYDTPEKRQAIMVRIAPNYDPKRVDDAYIEKIIRWYQIVVEYAPDVFVEESSDTPQ